jgi:exonuclease SbcC
MRLLNLGLENWSLHDQLDVPLANSLQIEGRNGTGKSSILDAIRFIFARDARRYKRKIKNGTRSCTVRLGFKKDGDEYLVEKSLYLDRSSTAQMLINSGVVASNPTEVYERLQNILPENILDKLLYVPQGGLVELVESLRIKGGRQELDSLLGLDRFERVYKGIKDEMNVKESNFDIISNQILKYPEDAEKVLGGQIAELEKEIASLKSERKGGKTEFEKIEIKIKKLENEIERIQVIKKGGEELQKRISDMRLEITNGKKEIEFLNQKLESIEEKKTRYEKLKSGIKDLGRYTAIRDLLPEVMRNEQRLVDVDNVEERRKELLRIQRELVTKEELEGGFKKTEAEVVKLERESAAKKQSLLEKEHYLESLDDLKDRVKCPRCGQKLTPEHIKSEKKIVGDEAGNLKKAVNELEEKLRSRKEKLVRVKTELDGLRKKEVEVICLREEIEEKEKDKSRIALDVKKLRERLSKADYRNESMETVNSRVEELHNIKGEIGVLQEELSREGEYRKGLKDINERIEKLSLDERDANEKLKCSEFDETILESLQYEKENLLRDKYGVQNKINQYELQTEHLEGRVKEIKGKIADFNGLIKQESDLRKEIRLLKDARDIFHTNKGIVKYLRGRYIIQLSNQMTYYFKRINQNPKYREIAFDREYDIEIKTTDGNFSLDQLSGGERVQLAIALRIALIRLISPINLLILDEPFGSLDREHREVLGEALNKIALDGQLVLVTHITVDSLNLPGRLELGGY